jgi:hypothetical protein
MVVIKKVILDFSLIAYKNLLNSLIDQGFSFLPIEEFVSNPANKVVVLRHDVDSLPGNSLKFAKIQAEKGIKGTYYFRIVPQSFDEKVIKEIAGLGHEIGYHYEDVARCAVRGLRHAVGLRSTRLQDNGRYEEELVKIAIESFQENLAKLREIAPVKTICMHGSPLSKWDSRLLWKYYDYRDFGIVAEPYFDIDFNKVLYLTDTGRRWDGGIVNVRDKGLGIRDKGLGEENRMPHAACRKPFPSFHSTFDIIRAAEEGRLPDKIMMTFHPQRWTDKPLSWAKELVWQNVKNVGKYFLIKRRATQGKRLRLR